MSGHSYWLATYLVVSCCACHDSHADREAARAADASSDETRSDAGPANKPASRVLTDEDAAWLAETDFEIVFERMGCFGPCPIYALGIRASGDVRFAGLQFVRKPGAYDVTIPAVAAATLYENMIRRGFLGFRPEYTWASGCSKFATDNPSSVFTLLAPDREKTVHYGHGCRDKLPEFDVLKTIEREILEATDANRFIEHPPGSCNSVQYEQRNAFASSYVLRDERGAALGLLRITPGDSAYLRAWSAATCDGEERSRGTRMPDWGCGRALVPSSISAGSIKPSAIDRLHSDALTLAWPGVDEPLAAVVATVDPNTMRLDLKLYAGAAELTQTAEQGERCEP